MQGGGPVLDIKRALVRAAKLAAVEGGTLHEKFFSLKMGIPTPLLKQYGAPGIDLEGV